jgi:hypothetical protein
MTNLLIELGNVILGTVLQRHVEWILRDGNNVERVGEEFGW